MDVGHTSALSTITDRLTASLSRSYRIDRELGAGGMATVYLAHDLKHDRDVAIKVLHPDLGAARGGERFLSETRTTARLQHPHILALPDSRKASQVTYGTRSTTSTSAPAWRLGSRFSCRPFLRALRSA